MSENRLDSETATPASPLLTGNIRTTVFWLALPVLGEQVLSFCVGFYDTWLSGQLSAEATAAIGLAAYVGWLASMVFALVGIGTSALVARHVGAGELDEARVVFNRSLTMGLLLGVVVASLLALGAPGFALLLGMTGSTRELVVRYLRIDAVGHVFSSATLVCAAALRGSGNMLTPMLILGLVSVSNIILSSAFVFGWGPWGPLGIDGIVLGTVLSRTLGGLIALTVLGRGLDWLRIVPSELWLKGPVVRRILRVGVPAAVDGLVMWGGHFAFLMIIARLGRDGFDQAIFAAHIVGIQVEALTYLPAVAWGQAAATMVGQSLGARLPDRASRAGHMAARQCGTLGILITAVFFFGARPIYSLMHEDAAVVAVGAPAFRMLALFQIPLIVAIVYTAALRGAGDTRAPLRYTCVSVLGVRVPVALLLGIVAGGGLFGAWIGMCADLALRSTLVFRRFRLGQWSRIQV